MATIDLKLKSYDELQFEIMTLIIDNHLKQQKIDQLTNNWNELEEWVKGNDKTLDFNYIVVRVKDVLDKMKEIKEGKNDKD